MDRFKQIQENLFDYFEDVEDQLFIDFVDSFAYQSPAKNNKVSKLAEKFIEDNELIDALAHEHYDKNEAQYFKRSSMSERSMLQEIRSALISISHNRFRRSLNKKANHSIQNRKNFNFLKNSLLECYESLNRHENYFDGEEEDAKFVEKIENITFK